MRLEEIKSEFEKKLSACYDERETSLITKYYFEDKGFNHLDPEQVSNIAQICFNDLDRLVQFEPLQYVTEKAHFYGLEMYVNRDVLIPRPETEELVYQCLKIIEKHPAINRVIDIGTGSGCIINTIAAKTRKKLDCYGIDVSENALLIAKRNAKSMYVDVTFKRKDILRQNDLEDLGKIDLIVSNPPYISKEESNSMSKNVLDYEPHLALFSESDPLLFYKAIASWAKSINPNSIVVCEINEHLGKETKNVFEERGYNKVEVLKDLQNKDRIIIASI